VSANAGYAAINRSTETSATANIRMLCNRLASFLVFSQVIFFIVNTSSPVVLKVNGVPAGSSPEGL
jgi:hypothetical protein